jgi:predicted nucleic acid-binding protein
MKIERATKVQVDTNVLLEATDEGRPLHNQALAVFQNARAAGIDLFICTQTVREYLVVATRPTANNGLGMGIKAALENVAKFVTRASILPETLHAGELFLEWAGTFRITGKKLHDLQILATAAAGGMHMLLTANEKDFPKNPSIAIAPLAKLEW